MSDQEEESAVNEDDKGKQLNFVEIIVKYPVLFDKSQLPIVKEKKSKAAQKAIEDLKTLHCQIYTEKTLMKKLSRIKNDVKIKSDRNKTGNKKVILKIWEELVLKLLGANDNPTICQVQGAASVGFGTLCVTAKPNQVTAMTIAKSSNTTTKAKPSSTITQLTTDPTPNHTNTNIAKVPNNQTKAKKRVSEDSIQHEIETEETKFMSTAKLQRLVLLEQLSLIRLKRQKLSQTNSQNNEMSNE